MRAMALLPYRGLAVWQKAHALAMEVLDIAEREPIARRFYLRDQICGAAMSIPANIAEGSGRRTSRDNASFVDIARGSLFELDWLYTVTLKGYASHEEYDRWSAAVSEINAMLFALARSLRARESR